MGDKEILERYAKVYPQKSLECQKAILDTLRSIDKTLDKIYKHATKPETYENLPDALERTGFKVERDADGKGFTARWPEDDGEKEKENSKR